MSGQHRHDCNKAGCFYCEIIGKIDISNAPNYEETIKGIDRAYYARIYKARKAREYRAIK